VKSLNIGIVDFEVDVVFCISISRQ